MPYVVVGLVSILVGGAVYLLSVRTDARATSAVGFGDDDGTGPPEAMDPNVPPAPGYAYLQVSTQRPALQDRIVGVFALVLLIGVSAAALALAIYQAGHLINQTIQAFLD